jgi:predicted  nucleic acid-binding Zn ribbon protein
MDHSLEDIESPTCPRCGVEMQLYRSELVKFVPIVDLHLFKCSTCLLFAELEMARQQVWVPPNNRVPCVHFFSPAA